MVSRENLQAVRPSLLPSLLLLTSCKLPEMPDVDLRTSALQEARERAELQGGPVHLDGSGVDAIIGRPAAMGLIDAGGRPLTQALESVVLNHQWSTAFNAQSVISRGPGSGQARGATWKGLKQLDPPDPGSEQLWTLDVITTVPPRPQLYRGNPKPDVVNRVFAMGGLEALAVAGDPEVSPTLAAAIEEQGTWTRSLGRTYLGIDRNRGVLAIIVIEHGAAGPFLTDLPDALRKAGFEDIVSFDGDISSALVHDHDGSAHVEAQGIHQPTAPVRYGIGVRWAR